MAKKNTCAPQNGSKKHRKMRKAVAKLEGRLRDYENLRDKKGFVRPGALKYS